MGTSITGLPLTRFALAGLVAVLALSACGSDFPATDTATSTSPAADAPRAANAEESRRVPSPSRTGENLDGETSGGSAMEIRLRVGETVLNATLVENATIGDFISLLPLTLTLRDYAGTEKLSDLPRRLSTAGAPAGTDPDVGDIAYYAPWGNLAIYYKDFGYSRGLVKLGRIHSGIEELAAMSDDFTITIEPAN